MIKIIYNIYNCIKLLKKRKIELMNEKKLNNDLRDFWNQWFSKIEPEKINHDDVKVENELDQYLKELGDTCERVLDFGSGTGHCLITTKLLGNKIVYGLGIDSAENGVKYANDTCKLSNIENLDFKVGDQHLLKQYEENSFDGIVCSNILDVVPLITSNEIIDEIKRLLKPGGVLVVKLNFYLTKEIISKIKMEKITNNTYGKNGILRGLNFKTEEWIKKFNELHLIKKGEYERIKNGPKDRILMFSSVVT